MSETPILKSHRRPGIETTVVSVGTVKFGDGSYPVIAGPMAVESEDQILAAARLVAGSGGSILRAGTYLAGSSPYAYRGLGSEALWMLEHAGRETRLPVSTEVLEPDHVDVVAEHVDLIEVGPDNMQNFVLLRDAEGFGLVDVLRQNRPQKKIRHDIQRHVLVVYVIEHDRAITAVNFRIKGDIPFRQKG